MPPRLPPTPPPRFQAEVAFDGGELARRCLDRVGRQRLFNALAAAADKRDAGHMDALLMQVRACLVGGGARRALCFPGRLPTSRAAAVGCLRGWLVAQERAPCRRPGP
jgi:hypothetical protein